MLENGETVQPETKVPEAREPLRDLIFSIPCTAIERQWLSHFYSRNDDLQKELLIVGGDSSRAEQFVVLLRRHIDGVLFSYIENPLLEGAVHLSLAERNFAVVNWVKYRDFLMGIFLRRETGNSAKAALALKRLRYSISNGLATEKQRPTSKRLIYYRQQAKVKKIVENETGILKILYLHSTDLAKFRQAQLQNSPWLQRQMERILRTEDGTLQLSLIKTLSGEFKRYLENPWLFDNTVKGF